MIQSQEAYVKMKERNEIKSNKLPSIAAYRLIQLPARPDFTLFLTETKEEILIPFDKPWTHLFFSNWILFIILISK